MKISKLRLLAGWLALAPLAGECAQDRGTAGTMTSDTGLVAHWCFDDADDLGADCSGHGLDSSPVGDPRPGTGRVGGSVTLDGASSFVVPSPFFLDGVCEATVSAFVHLDTLDRHQQILGAGDDRDSRDPLSFALRDGAMADVGFSDTIGQTWIKADQNNPRTHVGAGRWHHFAVSLQEQNGGSTMEIYVDGVLVETRTKPEPVCVRYDRPMQTQIGAIHGIQRWLGRLDEVRIHDRALRADEVAALAGAGND